MDSHTTLTLQHPVISLSSPFSPDTPDSPSGGAPSDSFCTHLRKLLSKNIIKIKEYLAVVVIVLILLGLIYNLLARDEKDIPEEVFQKLYKLLTASGGSMPVIGAVEDGKWQAQQTPQPQIKMTPNGNIDN